MQALVLLQHILDQSMEYVATCRSLPWNDGTCGLFWRWVEMGSVLGAGAFVLLVANLKAIRNAFKFREAPKAYLNQQQIALEETTAEPKRWGNAQSPGNLGRRMKQDTFTRPPWTRN